jgi:gliding motility-associated-like protein
LIDNFSSAIKEIPQAEIGIQNTCKDRGTGRAKVSIKGGVPPFRYHWSTDITGVNNDNNELHDLKMGTYNVNVMSANGLGIMLNFEIGETDMHITSEVISPSCYGYNDAVIKLGVTAGTPPYSYEMNHGLVVQNQPVFTKLGAGQYNFKITDDLGCSAPMLTMEVTQPYPLQVSATNAEPPCNDAGNRKMVINATGGSPPYYYSLDFHTWQTGNSFEQLASGKQVYYITDKNKCEASGEIEIKRNLSNCAIFMPNAFSPNGDGLNDIFRPKIQDDIHDFTMEIYNRYGQRIYLSHDPREGWSGVREATGTYIWTITYTDSKSQARKQQGSVMLIR